MPLTQRQQAILKAIVEDYVLTAEPVGSRVLAKRFDFGLSPATLRNEMADLEEGGLLRQPHTSAGRIPSDAGYRVFVDVLMQPQADLPADELRVLERFTFDARDLFDILQQAAKVTAVLSHCTAVVRAPNMQVLKIQFLQLLPLGPRDVMVVLLTDRGTTVNQLAHLPAEVSQEELAVLTTFLNHHLRGQPLDGLTGKVIAAMVEEMRQYEDVIRALWQRLAGVAEQDERVFVSNASYLAEQPEFGESLKIRQLLSLLERESMLASMLSLLRPGDQVGVHVAIGRENTLPDLHECSVVKASYSIGGQAFGEIAVMGPTRLGYPRAIAAVDTMARHLSMTLTRLFGYRGP
jgi:heat-inducible transcriptional repressor